MPVWLTDGCGLTQTVCKSSSAKVCTCLPGQSFLENWLVKDNMEERNGQEMLEDKHRMLP